MLTVIMSAIYYLPHYNLYLWSSFCLKFGHKREKLVSKSLYSISFNLHYKRYFSIAFQHNLVSQACMTVSAYKQMYVNTFVLVVILAMMYLFISIRGN